MGVRMKAIKNDSPIIHNSSRINVAQPGSIPAILHEVEIGAVQGVFLENSVGRSVPMLQRTQIDHRPAIDFEWRSYGKHLTLHVDLQEAPCPSDCNSISEIAARQTAQSQSGPH